MLELDLDAALDGYVRALGVGLQLGPAATEQALRAILLAARTLGLQGDADGLSALGPALSGLVRQVREAGALPATQVMEAWAATIDGLGALIGQVGLALTVPPERRSGLVEYARSRANLLDNATGDLFGLSGWLEELCRVAPNA